ncbi:hypothetical protein [Noviherbaspirillum malthae]|uniref:hypothetical protein n=1 Tax=Noviherbaspirillum malthae TaxID=1260987 RepID=UPI00188E96E7|nr:hypothetical protein [Noviherbaspirillum malthae]
MSRRFIFDLFRLNIEDLDDLFGSENIRRLRRDSDLTKLLLNATDPLHDQLQRTRSAAFKWSLRGFNDLSKLLGDRDVIQLTLARSVLEKDGLIVTDDGMSAGTSLMNPPLASTAVCLFDISRHLVAVEHTGDLAPTAWKDFFEQILGQTAFKMGFKSRIQLEPIPEQHGIIGLFKSFQRITRMRVTLRIPNPELNRYTRDIYNDLARSGVREITQDMKNPNGMSKAEDARPFASAVLAQQGYKKGEVLIEGVRNDMFEQVSSGSVAARGSVPGLREFIRGLSSNLRTKEAQAAIKAICDEIDKIHPIPGKENG